MKTTFLRDDLISKAKYLKTIKLAQYIHVREIQDFLQEPLELKLTCSYKFVYYLMCMVPDTFFRQ